jgi:hypothetical protein
MAREIFPNQTSEPAICGSPVSGMLCFGDPALTASVAIMKLKLSAYSLENCALIIRNLIRLLGL